MALAVATALILSIHSVIVGASLSSQQTITSNSIPRTFYYYRPSNYNASQGVMLYLHGGGGSGSGSASMGTDYLWQNLSDRVGVLSVFPEGKAYPSDSTSHTWNDCSDDVRPRQNCETCTDYDDVLFIRDLVHWLSTSYDPALNLKRVYAAGESKGALMSQRLALEANDIIAAVASIAGNVPVSNDNSGSFKCKGYDKPYGVGTSEAVPILLFKGDADPRIPFGATTGTDHNYYPLDSDWCHRPAYKNQCPPTSGYCVNGCVHSFFDTLAFWEWKHNLSPDPKTRVNATQTTQFADTIPDCTNDCPTCDGSYVIRHQNGPQPYRVTDYQAVGGGHHFPGPSADTDCSIEQSLGWKNRDQLSAVGGNPYIAEEIWGFVSQFALAD